MVLADLASARHLWPGLTVSDGGDDRRAYPQGRGLGGSGLVNGAVLSGRDLPQYDAWGWTGVAVARGRVRLPGVRKPVVLRTARATSYAGRTAVLTPAIPQKARRAVARATGNSRTKVVAKLVVTLRDSAGNAKKVVRTIRLS